MGNAWWVKHLMKPSNMLMVFVLLVGMGVVYWAIQKVYRKKEDVKPVNVKGGHVRSVRSPPSIPDVGQDGYKLVVSPNGTNNLTKQKTNTSLNLPAPVTPYPQTISEMKKENLFNSADMNIDPRIQMQWATFEKPFQTNATSERNGQIWLKDWSNLGPIDPFTPRQMDSAGNMVPTPGPVDPQLAYGMTLAAGLDSQATKFCVSENPDDITHVYKNNLQQIPGSHFEVFDASFDAYKTPQVVNRFSYLALGAASWVVVKLNEEFRKNHPCFSLAGREHFELQNPPMNCGDTSNQKESPITLIRVFECRVMKKASDNTQLIYLTMEIGNHVSAGSGGMFHTIVTMDDKGNFVDYVVPTRDEKQTFVLPRTRTVN